MKAWGLGCGVGDEGLGFMVWHRDRGVGVWGSGSGLDREESEGGPGLLRVVGVDACTHNCLAEMWSASRKGPALSLLYSLQRS